MVFNTFPRRASSCSILLWAGLLLSLPGCHLNDNGKTAHAALQQAAQQATQTPAQAQPLEQIPADIEALLQGQWMPADTESGGLAEPKYDIQAQQADAAAFFAGLVKDTPFSVALHPQVSGQISLDLKQVSLPEVFDVVSQLYGYDIQRSGNIFRIYPAGMRTETFSVNYLQMSRMGLTQTSIVTGGVSQYDNNNNQGRNGQGNFGGNPLTGGDQYGNNPVNNNSVNGTSIATRSESDFWTHLESSLRAFLGQEGGRSLVVSPQAGLVTVRAMPDELRAIRQYLQRSEQMIQRQVVLEARIIEVTLNDEFQQGIDWVKVANSSRLGPITFSGATVGNTLSNSLGGITSLNFSTTSFSSLLTLLSTQGNMQVLSSPRVTALNNQKAVIKVGDDEYFVTNVNSERVSTGTGSADELSTNVELTPFFSGISLDVTPQIDDQGGVLLHVHPSVIETREQEKIVTLSNGQIVLPLAQSNIRESDTVIHARSGEIVVIGGLMQTIISETHSKTPILGSLPVLGELFKNRQEQEQKKELVILIKPTVVDANTWRNQLSQSSEQVKGWIEKK